MRQPAGRHLRGGRGWDNRLPGKTARISRGSAGCHEFPIRNRAHGPTGGLCLDFCDPPLSAYPGQTAIGPCLASAIGARAHRREVTAVARAAVGLRLGSRQSQHR
jgi:hypothetical protein